MNRPAHVMRRNAPILLPVVAFVLSCSTPNEEVRTASPDSVMEARFDAAWAEIRAFSETRSESAPSGIDPQWRFAREFFDYYVEHGDTPTGLRAGRNAFMIWGNLPSADTVESALARLPANAGAWPMAVLVLGGTYSRADRYDDYPNAVRALESRIGTDEGRSALGMALASIARSESDPLTARRHYDSVIALDAVPFDVQKARSALYEMDSLQVGQPAPDFDALDLDGTPVRLADHRGKVVLIEFWATTCGPCMPLIPYLRDLHAELPESEFTLIGVTDDTDLELLRTFLRERDMAWTQIQQKNTFDDTGYLQQDPMNTAYNIFQIPRSFLIDREGRIVEKDLRNEALARATRALVAGGV